MSAALDRFFGLSRHGTTPAREIAAGVTTFLTMAYILFVTPNILGKALHLATGRGRQVHWIVFALAAALVARYGWLAAG